MTTRRLGVGPVQRGVFDGKPLSLNLTGAYAPEFACYLVTKQSEAK